MSENSCCDLKTGRFGLVRRSLGEGGWLFTTPCHGIAVRRRRNKTTIFISSTIFFQSNFAGLLNLPHKSIFLPLKIFIHRSTEVRVRQITDRHRDGNNISLEFKNPVMAHQAIS